MNLRSWSSFAAWLVKCLALATAYFLTGKLGLMLAMPPGYATAVWPPSGIAFAGLLLFGYRVAPGIALGSFLINIGTSFDGASSNTILQSLALATCIALGATLQAALGVFLLRRLISFPNPLHEARDIALLMLAGGPMSCLVAASVGVTCLWFTGRIQATEFLFNWWTWWLGDSLGVLTLTPVALIWAAKPRLVVRPLIVSVLLGAAFGLVVVLFLVTSTRERERIRRGFLRSGDQMTAAINDRLDYSLEVLYAVRSIYSIHSSLDREAFGALLRAFLPRRPAIQAVSWNPRIPHAQRADFEASMHRQGFPDYQIAEFDQRGELVPARARDEYYPVAFVEPDADNQRALGFDMASEELRRGALHTARDQGSLAMTSPVRLVQGRIGVLFFLPIYRGEERPADLSDDLVGVAVAIYRPDRLVEFALQDSDYEGIHLSIYDDRAPGGERLLYDTSWRGREAEASSPALRETGESSVHLGYQTHIDLAGRRWRLNFAATPQFLVANRSSQAWSVLAGGLMLISLLEAILLLVTGRAAAMAGLVRKRTHELIQAEQQLRALNENLERRIVERTTEAEERTQHLQLTNANLQAEVHQRELAEGALRASEERFRLIVNTALDAVISMDDAGLITGWNAEAQAIFGWSPAEAIGQELAGLVIPPQSREAYRRGRRHFLTTGEGPMLNRRVELTALRRDGHEFPVELSVSPSRKGATWLFNAFVRDITDRKRAERTLQRTNAELEQKNTEMEQFVYTVSHDLKSPLVTIRGFAGHIGRDVARGETERLIDFGQRINSAAERMMQLIDDLLKLCRVGWASPSATAVPMSELLRSIAKAHEEEWAQRDVRLIIQDDMPTLQVDELGIKQVFENLLVNAVTHGSDGLQPQISVGARAGGGEVRFFVKDNGRGIPPEHHAKIFELFKRLRTDTDGTGVGLAIVKRVVEAHHGRAWIESSPGQGATFWVAFPTGPAVPYLQAKGKDKNNGTETRPLPPGGGRR